MVMAIGKKEPTPYEQGLIDSVKKIKEMKLPSEANVVSILYKQPDLFYSYDNLNLDLFSHNEWKVYFSIIKGLFVDDKIKTIGETEIGLYLEKHPKLKEKYDEYGGYTSIEDCTEYVSVNNFDAYLNDLRKWNVVLNMLKPPMKIYLTTNDISIFADMSAEDIYNIYETRLNHAFANIDGGIKSYNIADGIDELIDELNNGMAVGLDYYNLPILNRTTGGLHMGEMIVIGGLSNVGKSSFVRNTIFPSIIEKNEKLVILLNEEGIKKWQREMLVWVANNIFKHDIQKYVVRDGKYSENTLNILRESAEWIKQQRDNKTITLIPIQTYTTSLAIKEIKKYSAMGIKYFIIDTFKSDSGKSSDSMWQELMVNAVSLHDVIKEEAKNVNLILTYQLEKGKTSRQRYYSQDNLGVSKNVIDTCGGGLFIRNLFPDEYSGGKNELKVYRLEGKNGQTKIPVPLDPDRHYQIIFIVKNREGGCDYQIVVEHDLSKNLIKEVGITKIDVDF